MRLGPARDLQRALAQRVLRAARRRTLRQSRGERLRSHLLFKLAGFVTEAGDVENWNGGIDKAKAMEALDETIKLWEQAKK